MAQGDVSDSKGRELGSGGGEGEHRGADKQKSQGVNPGSLSIG